MREILFRGKRIDNGEWVEVQTLVVIHQDDNDLIFMPQHGEDVTADPMEGNDRALTSIYGNYYQILPQTVGQYTGLTDKNGKKIFEGDICNINIPRIDGEFSTHNNCLCSFEYGKFMFSSYSDIYFCVGDGYGYHDTCNKNIEVIGNIHDNPELLEVTK